jgi:hypothetical protein
MESTEKAFGFAQHEIVHLLRSVRDFMRGLCNEDEVLLPSISKTWWFEFCLINRLEI